MSEEAELLRITHLDTAAYLSATLPSPGAGGRYINSTPEEDCSNRRTFCVWETDSEFHRVEVCFPSGLVGQGPPPPSCDWLPLPWQSNFIPLGGSGAHYLAWFDLAQNLFDLPDHACRALKEDDPTYGYRTFVRAARLLAVHVGAVTAALAGNRLPANRDEAFAELLTHRDALAMHLSRPATNNSSGKADPFSELRSLGERLRLKGKEAAAVLALCDGNGSVALSDLGVRFEWDFPAGNWNSLRKRLNDKMRKHGWYFETLNNNALARRSSATGRK